MTAADDTTGGAELGPPVEPEGEAPTRRDEWIDLLADPSGPMLRPELFGAAIAGVARAAESQPHPDETFGRVVERRGSQAYSGNALAEITEGLQALLGLDAAYLVHWLSWSDTTDRLEQIEAIAPAHVTAFLRAALAEHGATLDQAQRAAASGPNDWARVDTRAFVDTLTGRQLFSITINKVDGSVTLLECAPDSLMNLASRVIELTNAPRSMAGYSAEALGRFTRALQDTIAMLTEAYAEEPDDEERAERGADEVGR